MRMKKQTIILTAAVMTLFLIGSVLSNAPAAYAKTSHHSSKGNASIPSNQTSSNNNSSTTHPLSLSNPALSLSNPALNNLQPSGGGGQNNTNPPNQAIVKALPGLTQLIPGGQNNTSSGTPTNNTSGPVKIIKSLRACSIQLGTSRIIQVLLRITQADQSK